MTIEAPPPYVRARPLAGGAVVYTLVLPPHQFPQSPRTTYRLDPNRDSAYREARAILADLGWSPPVKTAARGGNKEATAADFARLDALSRTRALTRDESMELERAMRVLRLL